MRITDQRVALKKALSHITTNMAKDKFHPYNSGLTELARRIGCSQSWISQV